MTVNTEGPGGEPRQRLGIRIRTTQPLAYKRPHDPAIHICPAGIEGVTVAPEDDDPPLTFRVSIDDREIDDGAHVGVIIPSVVDAQVEIWLPGPPPPDFTMGHTSERQ